MKFTAHLLGILDFDILVNHGYKKIASLILHTP